jgi:hypothetical protein
MKKLKIRFINGLLMQNKVETVVVPTPLFFLK